MKPYYHEVHNQFTSFSGEYYYQTEIDQLREEIMSISKKIDELNFKMSLSEQEKDIFNEIAGEIIICK